MIEQVNESTYRLVNRGHEMTLYKKPDGAWEMVTNNASSRAYNNGRCSIPKYFRSIDEVEKQYKSWRGIAALIHQEACWPV